MSVATRGGWLRWMPHVTVAVFALPIAAGLVGTLLPAFGFLPAIGGHDFSLEPWRRLGAYPGFTTAVLSTLSTGIVTAGLAVVLAFGFCAWSWDRPWTRRLSAAIAPVLATPHSSIAIGLAFLVAPSGWIVRGLSPWLTGWDLPPDVATVGHPSGAALILGLLVKEVPYLILMVIGAMNQVPVRPHLAIARSLGYSRTTAWLKVILPQIYPQIRLPVYAVIAFSLSVVDVALVLGPTNPPPLAVLAVRWFTDADIQFYFPAAAAATLLLLLVVLVVALWFVAERAVAALGRSWVARGVRSGPVSALAGMATLLVLVLFAAAALSIIGMALWSFAAQWRFPDALPSAWSLVNWARRGDGLFEPALNTLGIGLLATVIALLLVLACLENESATPAHRGKNPRAGGGALWLLYLPLLVPQVAFLFGAQVLLVRLNLDGALLAVVWAHLVFVLPYLFLSLADPWRALDPRYARAGASLGASRTRVFLTIKLPLLLRPLLIACAVAFAVSVGQYLATLFAGNGRVPTLTTEAVTLAAGADRRVIGAYALLQALLPLVGFIAAAAVPAAIFANRRGVPRWN